MKKPRLIEEVWVSMGMTINIGNYESVRIDAGITTPTKEFENKDDAFKHSWDIVMTEVRDKVKLVKENKNIEQTELI